MNLQEYINKNKWLLSKKAEVEELLTRIRMISDCNDEQFEHLRMVFYESSMDYDEYIWYLNVFEDILRFGVTFEDTIKYEMQTQTALGNLVYKQ